MLERAGHGGPAAPSTAGASFTMLPDNGVVNWDGNRLRGNFYAFQVGTVKFIPLDADDVIYQDGAANYVIGTPNTAPEKTTTGAQRDPP